MKKLLIALLLMSSVAHGELYWDVFIDGVYAGVGQGGGERDLIERAGIGFVDLNSLYTPSFSDEDGFNWPTWVETSIAIPTDLVNMSFEDDYGTPFQYPIQLNLSRALDIGNEPNVYYWPTEVLEEMILEQQPFFEVRFPELEDHEECTHFFSLPPSQNWDLAIRHYCESLPYGETWRFTNPTALPKLGVGPFAGDINGDFRVDAFDAAIVFETWTGDPAPVSLPEPTGGLLVAAGVLLVMRRRR